jgi:hypothetical protein
MTIRLEAASMAIGRVWNNFVREFAEEAGRDPVCRLARLEQPPIIENAATNAKWHEADLRYRQAKKQLESEIAEANARSDAPWKALTRFFYSGESLGMIFSCLYIYFFLSLFGVTDRMWQALWRLLETAWSSLW